MVIKFSSPKRDRRLGGACEVEIMDLVEVSDVLNFGTNSSLGFISTGLFVYEPNRSWTIAFYNILWAETLQSELVIWYAATSKSGVKPATLKFAVKSEEDHIKQWIERLMNFSYLGSKQAKMAKVLLNPVSGQGKAKSLFSKKIEPLLRAAKCSLDVVETEKRGDGITIMKELDIDSYDMVVICSGDGLAHEAFNGLGKRVDAMKALKRIPIAHLPCGSGNGLSHNLNGTGEPSLATLAVIKGIPKPIDLISVTQGDKRILSFLSQSTGIGAESDIATENLRWMGAARFKLGFVARILSKKIYPADIALKIAIDDKSSILAHYQNTVAKLTDEYKEQKATSESSSDYTLPQLKYGTVNDRLPEDWVVIRCDNIGTFYSGNLPYMGADAKFFPAALLNDGLMDVFKIDGNIGRLTAIKAYNAVGEDDFTFFDLPLVDYRKVLAYRWTPRDQDSGYLSIDGESYPFEPFQAEIHQGLGTVIVKNTRIAGA